MQTRTAIECAYSSKQQHSKYAEDLPGSAVISKSGGIRGWSWQTPTIPIPETGKKHRRPVYYHLPLPCRASTLFKQQHRTICPVSPSMPMAIPVAGVCKPPTYSCQHHGQAPLYRMPKPYSHQPTGGHPPSSPLAPKTPCPTGSPRPPSCSARITQGIRSIVDAGEQLDN